MKDISIDLETLGTSAGCAIVSIGAVAFDLDRDTLGDEFYAVISMGSVVQHDLRIDASTVEWWMQQSDEARRVFRLPGKLDLVDALDAFADWVSTVSGHSGSVRVWGNGSDFDNAILAEAYRKVGRVAPWRFWNSRCLRTLQGLAPDVKIVRSAGHHNALVDAREQAAHIIKLNRHLLSE